MSDSAIDLSFLGILKPGTSEWKSLSPSIDLGDRSHEEANAMIKDALQTGLQMQHVVALAGSGTSLGSVSGPSMGDLWLEATSSFPAIALQQVMQIVHHPNGSRDIEELLSRAEAFLQLTHIPEVASFLVHAKEKILKRCSEGIRSEGLGAHRDFIHRMSRRRTRDPRFQLFTTNYDTCFEQAANTLGNMFIDGFSFGQPRTYNPRYFAFDVVRRGSSSDDHSHFLEGVFHLHKLHGSVNWERNGTTVTEVSKPSPEKACLIYPASRKFQQSFLQPHLESLSQYLESLRSPNTCMVVLGFGFNDDHLSEPILGALESNPHLRLIIVDPKCRARIASANQADDYWSRFARLGRSGADVWFVNATFEEFVGLIPNLTALTPAEQLSRTIHRLAAED